jgi:hypothetical protein
MEKYCITLDQSKRLVELGFEKDSYFVWYADAFTGNYTLELGRDYFGLPAYHVGQLGEILKNDAIIFIEFDDTTWNVFRSGLWIGKYPTEAQARGALLIFLLEAKLL